MPEDNTNTNPTTTAAPVLPDVLSSTDTTSASRPEPTPAASTAPAPQPKPVSAPTEPVSTPTEESTPREEPASPNEVYSDVANKISESHNVLIALSSDPSVDEMAAAIGLSLYLDKLGKRATAIYSGATPNALEFLKPEETFEDSADTLQDFVIALNKDKADHLRYKLDGDFVKIYITPYKTRISKDDLDFSYGDYNVDLVLALDVANGIDLDSALREHGRIMHDAVIINITTGKPGKFGEIEWSDKSASSVSEMIAELLYHVNSDVKIGKDEATAFLTGIVAATNRFSNKGTTPKTMKVASRLMESGANQQLVAKNITPDIENELFSLTSHEDAAISSDEDPTKLDIEHHSDKDEDEDEDESKDKPDHKDKDNQDKADKEDKETTEEPQPEDTSLMDDLKAAAASLAQAGAETTPTVADHNTVKLDTTSTAPAEPAPAAPAAPTSAPVSTPAEPVSTEPSTPSPVAPTEPASTEPTTSMVSEPSTADFISDKPEKVIEPSADLSSDLLTGEVNSNKYGQMLEDALNSINAPASESSAANPATLSTPSVPDTPEINGVPEMNYMPTPGEEILPPPPTPPIGSSELPPVPTATPAIPDVPAAPIAPATPVSTPAEPAPATPTMSIPTTPTTTSPAPAAAPTLPNAQSTDVGAFKIPGM